MERPVLPLTLLLVLCCSPLLALGETTDRCFTEPCIRDARRDTFLWELIGNAGERDSSENILCHHCHHLTFLSLRTTVLRENQYEIRVQHPIDLLYILFIYPCQNL